MTARGAAYQNVTLDDARIAYRIQGAGPAIILINNNRRPRDTALALSLAEDFRVLQVHPVGFGASDRPEAYAFGSIDAQVLAVADEEGIDRFAVWGFSQTACMAALVARATDRAVALVAGGVPLIGIPSDATMRRLEREPRLPVAALEFWRAYRSFDWHHELRAMRQPKIVYLGTDAPNWKALRKVEPVLRGCGCDCLQFEGLDHRTAGPTDDSDAGRITRQTILGRLDHQLPDGW